MIKRNKVSISLLKSDHLALFVGAKGPIWVHVVCAGPEANQPSLFHGDLDSHHLSYHRAQDMYVRDFRHGSLAPAAPLSFFEDHDLAVAKPDLLNVGPTNGVFFVFKSGTIDAEFS